MFNGEYHLGDIQIFFTSRSTKLITQIPYGRISHDERMLKIK